MISDNTRIIDLTVGELRGLLSQHNEPTPCKEKHFVYGIAGIAQLFNCSMTTANRIKASGKIDQAISQCGRVITIDADMAISLLKK